MRISAAPLLVLFLSIILLANCASDCFGAECQNKSPAFSKDQRNSTLISDAIERSLKAQFWYYLRQAALIRKAYLETPERLMIFYFHRNIVGTFFTVCSWYYNETRSEVNTLVRIGNGQTAGTQGGYRPADIAPFVITFQAADNETLTVTLANETLTVGGETIPFTDLNALQSKCKNLSDTYLRSTYWYYLDKASMITSEVKITSLRTYVFLTYVNIVGTFFVISSCEGDSVQVNTFVRLGAGSANPSTSIIVDPIALEVKASA